MLSSVCIIEMTLHVPSLRYLGTPAEEWGDANRCITGFVLRVCVVDDKRRHCPHNPQSRSLVLSKTEYSLRRFDVRVPLCVPSGESRE